MTRQPPIIYKARQLHARFLAAGRVRPPEGHITGHLFEEAADVSRWLTTGNAPRLVHLEVKFIDLEWAQRVGRPGGWRLFCYYGGRDLGAAVNVLWSAALGDVAELADGEGRPIPF